MTELSKRFNFKEVDEKWSNHWVDKGLFHTKPHKDKKPYTIVIPPPNVTGILHMGHALNDTLQDIIIRYKRMNGYEALWMPGTDHAGIATQNVVEKQLAKEGQKRQDLGRDAFVERLWDWKQQYGDTIIHQLKKLGSSCDWSRTRFTMDDDYSHAVKDVFIKLYAKGLIYRGQYIINWCPRCQTALSDEEVEHEDLPGNLYHIKYALKEDPNKFLVVATTRPETMLGDTAVAVNPKDERYKDFIGKNLILPLVNREIPIIEDDFVNPEFGTGAVKVTPAHDPNDFDIGKRHDLPFINILNPDATLNKEAGADYEGMDRFEAREVIISTLKEAKLLTKVEQHTHAVGHCYRCHTVIEPYISKQWFVKMKPLAGPARDAVTTGAIKFYPDRWTKVYLNWMDNIRDWCISRQIWWGHRIPVWYDDQENIYVAYNEEEALAQARDKRGEAVKLRQDPDVLDTWFSSWLWPFATLGWPNKSEDLDYFYPTASLFTASEIIFFWVARMVMAGIEFIGEIPFKDVYIHGTVRDTEGRKMSKSLGNAIDPLEIINEYGADALRFSLIMNSGQDLFVSKEKFEVGRNFANKIWNATRLILMNTSEIDSNFDITKKEHIQTMELSHQWIISKFYTTLQKVNQSIESYRYSEAETLMYEFFWSNFCDWYLEIIKNKWDDKDTQNVTYKILELSLQMMHPFMPFVTEEIWQHIKPEAGEICTSLWPEIQSQLIDESKEEQMSYVIDMITAVRNMRAQWNISPKLKTKCYFDASGNTTFNIQEHEQSLLRLAQLETLEEDIKITQRKNIAITLVHGIKIAIDLGEVVDVAKEKARMIKEREGLIKLKDNLAKRLDNKSFTDKAPKEVVKKEKGRLEALEQKTEELQKVIASLH